MKQKLLFSVLSLGALFLTTTTATAQNSIHLDGVDDFVPTTLPAINGNTAKITGTAPRNPTQEINVRSFQLKLRNGSKPIKIDRGRANKIIHRDNSSAGTAIGKS